MAFNSVIARVICKNTAPRFIQPDNKAFNTQENFNISILFVLKLQFEQCSANKDLNPHFGNVANPDSVYKKRKHIILFF